MQVILGIFIISIVLSFISEANKKRTEQRMKELNQANKQNRSHSPSKTVATSRKRSVNPFNQMIDELKTIVDEEMANERTSTPRNAAKSNRPERLQQTGQTKAKDAVRVSAFGEGETYEDSISSMEGASLEGLPFEIGTSDEGYFDREMDRVDRDLSSALEEMDATFEKESQQLNKELDKLFAHMDEGDKPFEMTASTNLKAKSTAAKLGLTNKSEIKRGILLKEILDKPLAKRG